MFRLEMNCLIIGIFFLSCSMLSNPPRDGIYLADDLVNDMFLPHEGIPHGVPVHYGWRTKPGSTYGLNPPAGWNKVVAWGHVYAEESQPNPDTDFPKVRVHLKDLQLYVYLKNGTWKLVQDQQGPDGVMYTEDLRDHSPERPTWKNAEIQKEDGGGVSVKAGSGYNFHFYTSRKDTVNPSDISGVFVVCKARLIGVENYSKIPKYLVNVGGDWYNSSGSGNNDIAIGRFKYVTPVWQYFIMHTFSKEEVKNIVFPDL